MAKVQVRHRIAVPPPVAAAPGRETIARPSPLIRQSIASDVRRARVLGTMLRVGVLLVADTLLVLALHLALGWVRASLEAFPSVEQAILAIAPHGTFPRIEMIAAVLIGLVVFGNYRSGRYRYNARALFAASLLGLSLVAWTDLWFAFSLARAIGFTIAVLALAGALVLDRKLVDVLVARYASRRQTAARTLIIGTQAASRRVAASCAKTGASTFNVIGFLDPTPHISMNALGGVADFVRLVEKFQIDTILFAEALSEETMGGILDLADDLGCAVIAAWYEFPFRGFVPTIARRRGVPVVAFERPSLVAHQLVAKRAFDFVVASVLFVLALPLFVVIAIAIKLDSRGPVLFGATRVGFGGSVFRMLKFRSMIVNSDAQRLSLKSASVYADGRLFKIVADPRITRVGRFLRRSSLDELPQLWNVIRGEMSLVGPRPPLPDEVVHYEEYHYDRFGMRPGITGPWQVSGRNAIRDFERVVQLETEYIQSWSIGRDIDILLRTVPAVLSMSGV